MPECHDLRRKKENDLPDGGKTEICPDIDAVVDNGADAVYIHEERDQEEQHLLVMSRDLFESPADLAEDVGDLSFFSLHVVDLLIFPEERDRDCEPPEARDHEADDPGRPWREQHQAFTETAAENIRDHRDNERDAGAYIPPCITIGGDLVHALFRRDVVEHRVVESERKEIEDPGQDEQYDEDHP